MAEEEIIGAAEAVEANADEEQETVIRDTDIVFDCPHCGHNLAIDYRGAGLPITCVNCGESVLVPIPNGMKIDDLDLDNGETLKQLFATRRNLQKAELRAEMLEGELAEANDRVKELEGDIAHLAERVEALKGLCKRQATVQRELAEVVDGLFAEPAEGEAAASEGDTAVEA